MSDMRSALPASYDVVLVLALDVVESTGIDVRSDIRNFISQGLNVGMVSMAQVSAPNRYRNLPLVKMCFDLDIPLLGHRDACQAQLAIVYQPDLFVERGVRGKFAAQRIWMVTEHGQYGALSVETITSKAAAHCDVAPTFVAASPGEHALIASSGEQTDLWNFHVSGTALETTADWKIHAAPEGGSDLIEAGNSVPERIGFPATVKLTPHMVAELKSFSAELRKRAGYVLCAQMSVPKPLQTADEVQDVFFGFPFVPKDRKQFLASLRMYVVPRAALHAGTWRDDVYACMELGVPVGLPRELEPYFGSAALYFDSDASELLTATGGIDPEAANSSIRHGRRTVRERTYSAGIRVLAKYGVEPARGRTGDGISAKGTAANMVSVPSGNTPRRQRPRVCFVTSNGAGMGHLTRLLAVARRLDDDVEVSFVSMSQACGVVAGYGYDFEYIPSKGDLLVDGQEWNQYFNKRFQESLDRLQPDAVVFDGTWPYQGIVRAIANNPAKFVWMRRGMWRSKTANTSLVRHTGFDSVIEPGDIAGPYDQGPTSHACDAYKVDPIIVLDPEEVLPRGRAREALGLGPMEKAMLITLGAGNINKIDDDVEEVILAVKALPEKWRIFMTSPLIAENVGVTEGVENLSIYPLARFAGAFDFVVSATGYNSFHEWIAYSVPTLWIANASTVTDDQIGRARYAHDAGLGLAAGPGGSVSIPDAINLLGQEEARVRMRQAMERAAFSNGAAEAARHISVLVRGGGNP